MFSECMLGALLKSINIPISRRAMSTLYHTCDKIEQRIIWIDCEMTGLDVEKQVSFLYFLRTLLIDKTFSDTL